MAAQLDAADERLARVDQRIDVLVPAILSAGFVALVLLVWKFFC